MPKFDTVITSATKLLIVNTFLETITGVFTKADFEAFIMASPEYSALVYEGSHNTDKLIRNTIFLAIDRKLIERAVTHGRGRYVVLSHTDEQPTVTKSTDHARAVVAESIGEYVKHNPDSPQEVLTHMLRWMSDHSTPCLTALDERTLVRQHRHTSEQSDDVSVVEQGPNKYEPDEYDDETLARSAETMSCKSSVDEDEDHSTPHEDPESDEQDEFISHEEPDEDVEFDFSKVDAIWARDTPPESSANKDADEPSPEEQFLGGIPDSYLTVGEYDGSCGTLPYSGKSFNEIRAAQDKDVVIVKASEYLEDYPLVKASEEDEDE